MIAEEERNAIVEMLRSAVLENVPSALESGRADGFAFSSGVQGQCEPFCLILIKRDQVEMHFPDVKNPGTPFEPEAHGQGCRLTVRKRTDIPGDMLIDVLEKTSTKK